MKRREFIHYTAGLAALGAGLRSRAAAATGGEKSVMKAAIIGYTGRGRYGHSLELVFSNRPGIEVVAVADPVEAARKKVQQTIGAPRSYADYREMLEKERPNLVSVAPRWTDHRREMVGAVLAAGGHVYCEKPFTHSLEDADYLLAQAKRANRKIAVAHAIRLTPGAQHLKRRIDEGLLGELRSIRVNGKTDRRAGGEDLLVHGTHLFDLVRMFAGDPTEVTARILHQGRDITRADKREGDYDKAIGPVAGDDVEAWFKLSKGVDVHYTTRRKPSAPAGPFSLEFVGSRGSARMACGFDAIVTVLRDGKWVPLEGDPTNTAKPEEKGRNPAQARVIDDWLAAIRENREPQCSGYGGMKIVEMVHGIYAAALSHGKVEFPLKDRRHPLLVG